MVIETALMIASVLISFIIMPLKGKKGKKGANDNPVIGKRYWGDALNAYAYYSPRTASLWANRVFRGSEESNMFAHMDYAGYFGDTQNVGASRVDSGLTTAFTVPFDAAFTGWDTFPHLHRTNKIPRFTRARGQTPQFPCHMPGIAYMAMNQAYMGLNAATLPSYVVVWSSIPGTVYRLMQLGGDYANTDLWVRWRKTIDLGWTIGINPVCIVTDILLDQKTDADISWESVAYCGKKLVTQQPYMWFSMAIGARKQKEAVKDVLEKARIAIKQEADGRIGLKLVGEVPENGPAAFTIIDALQDVSEFTISVPSVDESEVINEVRGTYLAARFDVESDFEKLVLPEDQYEAYKQWEAAHAGELQGRTLEEKLKLFPGLTGEEAEKSQAIQDTSMIAQFEGHLLEADAHAVNTGNIVLTGVRRQESYTLDFLAWPDDAQAYLEEVLVRNEQPYAKGSVTAGMWLSDKTVGDIVRLVVRDIGVDVQLDKVFEVMQVTIGEFPTESVTLDLKENHTWYDVLTPLPDGSQPPVDPNTGEHEWEPGGVIPTPPAPRIFSMPMVMHAMSPSVRGVPALHFCTSHATNLLASVSYYMVPSCAPEFGKNPDDMLGSDNTAFPTNFRLAAPILIEAGQPRHLGNVELDAIMMVPPMADINEMANLLAEKIDDYSGTLPLMFTEEHATKNFFILSNAQETLPCGVGVLCRATSMTTYVLDDEVHLRVKGVYVVDAPMELNLPIGSILTVLPPSTPVSDYGYAAAPMPLCYGQVAQVSGTAINVRTLPASSTEEVAWDVARCAMYIIPDEWMQTQEFPVYGRNAALDEPGQFGDSVFITTEDDVVELLFDAPNYTQMAPDTSLFGMVRAYRGNGLDLDTTPSAALALTTTENADIRSGIMKLQTTVRIKRFGVTTVATLTGNPDPVKKRFTLRDLNIVGTPGEYYTTEIEATYVMDSTLLDQTTTLDPVTIQGPRLLYGPV